MDLETRISGSCGAQRRLATPIVGDTGRRYESVTAKFLRDLLDRQDYRCALTGWELEPSTATIDHIMPLARGGDHVPENAQIVHASVNQAKGTMTMDEFVEMCRAVVTLHGEGRGSL